MERTKLEILARKVVDAVFEVHRELGAGLLEAAYKMALCRELSLHQIRFEQEKVLPVIYKGVKLECGFRVDLLIEGELILELKSVEELLPIHEAQLINYLRLMDKPLGFLINFNVPLIKDGIKRRAGKLEQGQLRPRDFELSRLFGTTKNTKEQCMLR